MCSGSQKGGEKLKKRLVTIETLENVCQAYKSLSPLKKEKAKTYILGLMDSREAAEYEKSRGSKDPAA